MTQEQPNTKFFRISGQSSIIILGGIILILWLIATPPGLWGKADAVGYAVCHRIAIRSFHLESKQLPLCARCTGQYLGAIIGLSYLGVFSKRRSGFPSKPVIASSVYKNVSGYAPSLSAI
jgi:hypothetical protein